MSTDDVDAALRIFQGLLMPFIAVVAVYIAWQQWATSRNRLKLDLFGKRYVYYEAATELIGRIMTSGKASDELAFAFLSKTKGARFLIGERLAAYLDDLYRKAVDLNGLGAELEALDGPERSQNIRRQREIKDWLQAQYEVLDEEFGRLLNLEH